MATFNIQNHLVFPTENDVNGGTVGAGRIITEAAFGSLLKSLLGQAGQAVSGFTMPSSGALTQSIAGGTAVIDGYVVVGTGTTSVTFAASNTTHVFLRLIYVSGKVASVQFELLTVTGVDDDPIPPANSILLGRVSTDGTSVTGSSDFRANGRVSYGMVKWFGGSDWRTDNAGSSDWRCEGVSSTSVKIHFIISFPRTPIIILVSNPVNTTYTMATTSRLDIGNTTTFSANDIVSFILLL